MGWPNKDYGCGIIFTLLSPNFFSRRRQQRLKKLFIYVETKLVLDCFYIPFYIAFERFFWIFNISLFKRCFVRFDKLIFKRCRRQCTDWWFLKAKTIRILDFLVSKLPTPDKSDLCKNSYLSLGLFYGFRRFKCSHIFPSTVLFVACSLCNSVFLS